MNERTRVLIPISEPIGGQMSAVGIRKLEIARVLAGSCDVTLATSAAENDPQPRLRIAPCRSRAAFRDLLAEHDVLYTLGLTADRFLDVVRSGIRIVLDMYTPLAFEILEAFPEAPLPLVRRMHRRVVRWTIAQFAHADFIVCTGDAQRDLWLGTMNAVGLIDAGKVRDDPDCRRLIDVVPMGIAAQEPKAGGQPLRDRLPALGQGDFILLWCSKILAWQDPATLMRAMHLLSDTDPDVRLVFLGTGLPPAAGRESWLDPAALRTRQAFALADDLKLLGRNVFFISERIPYRDIGSYYLDADAAVATYPDSLETRYCLGTRLLDYVWAGLPVAVSGGALQREFVEGQGVGYVAPPYDAEALAAAIRRLKSDVRAGAVSRSTFEAARQRLSWSMTAEPVVRYCTSAASRARKDRRQVARALFQWLEFVGRSISCRVVSRMVASDA